VFVAYEMTDDAAVWGCAAHRCVDAWHELVRKVDLNFT
jgi:hypothetical protein